MASDEIVFQAVAAAITVGACWYIFRLVAAFSAAVSAWLVANEA